MSARLLRKLIVLLPLLLPHMAAQASRAPEPANQYRSGELLVRFHAEADRAALRLKSRLALARAESLLDGRIERLQLPGYLRLEDALALLAADPAVAWAEPVYRRQPSAVSPNDPMFASQWPLLNTGQSANGVTGVPGADMKLTDAWDANNDGSADRTGDGSVTVAIIDDGFELGHPDLAANFISGYDFRNDDANPRSDNSNESHGTLVAGCIGAVGNNGIGIAGAAWNVKLMPLKFGFDTASELRAIAYARDNGAKIVNASFGGPEFSMAERDAIADLGDHDILFIASAGNLDSNTDFAGASYPANYDLPNVISVAANDRRDQLAGFSQFGARTVDLVAPGVRTPTTALGGRYSTPSGTSFSSPYTAGIAALIRMSYPAANFREVKARLIEGAANGDGLRQFSAAGRVDADASLDLTARPSLLIHALQFEGGDSDGSLDPGENLTLAVTLENYWLTANNLVASLVSDDGTVTVLGAPVALGSLASASRATARFAIRVADLGNSHHYAGFSLRLTADGYSSERRFNAELARLTANTIAIQSIQSNDQDEFHTWHFELGALPAGHNQLVVQSTSEGNTDIDILVKQGAPPQYDISLSVEPESGQQIFYADIPSAQIGGELGGAEKVSFSNPAAGSYYVTVVNYTQTANLRYSLCFHTQASSSPTLCGSTPGSSSSSGGSSSSSSLPAKSGGGAFSACWLLLGLLRLRRR